MPRQLPPFLSALLLLLLLLLAHLPQSLSSTAPRPFNAPLPNQSPSDPLHHLFVRQSSCPLGYAGCANLNAPTVCCPTTDICSADAAKHVACCPIGAACTGTIGSSSATTSNGAFVGGVPASTTTTALVAGPTPTSTFPLTAAAGPQSTVPNPYFPWIYAPSSYPDAAQCESYLTSCQTEFRSCTSSLGGAVNGVTVSAVGGGITRLGQASQTAAAASICTSLYQVGCNGLQEGQCAQYGGPTLGATQGVVGGNAARGRRERIDVLGVMAGVVVAAVVGMWAG